MALHEAPAPPIYVAFRRILTRPLGESLVLWALSDYDRKHEIMTARPRTIGIYAITKHGSVVYVGHSTDTQTREMNHRSGLRRGDHPNKHLRSSWKKHGEDAFDWIILEECPVDQLLIREQYHMDQYPDRYNVLPAAGSNLGYKHTEESKAKMSVAKTGSKHTPETIEKLMGNTNGVGHKVTAEERERIRSFHTGRKRSPESCAKMSEAQTGRKHTPEAKAKMSEAQRGREFTSEHRANISAGKIGHEVGPEARKKIGDASRGRKDGDETREKKRVAALARWERKRAEQEQEGVE